jgi:hypothetical protein
MSLRRGKIFLPVGAQKCAVRNLYYSKDSQRRTVCLYRPPRAVEFLVSQRDKAQFRISRGRCLQQCDWGACLPVSNKAAVALYVQPDLIVLAHDMTCFGTTNGWLTRVGHADKPTPHDPLPRVRRRLEVGQMPRPLDSTHMWAQMENSCGLYCEIELESSTLEMAIGTNLYWMNHEDCN